MTDYAGRFLDWFSGLPDRTATVVLLAVVMGFAWHFTAQLDAQSQRYDPLVQKVDNLWCRNIAESRDADPDLCDRLYPTDDLGRLVDLLQTLGTTP